MKKDFNQKKRMDIKYRCSNEYNRRRKNNAERYGVSHLSAGEAKVLSSSTFTVGEFTIELKEIEEKNNVQINSFGSAAEVTDYAILMGAEYFESDDKKKMGYYWTDTPIESKKPLDDYYDCPGNVTAYKLKEEKTQYHFYGYSVGKEISEIEDPCILAIDGKLFLNKDGELWTLKHKTSLYLEATIGASMAPLVPIPNEYISSEVPDRYLGRTAVILKNNQRRIEEKNFLEEVRTGKYRYVAGNNSSNIRNVNDKSVGIRPIFKTYNHSTINVPELNGIKVADAMDFPQTIATKEEQKELEELFKNNKLNKTNRYFPTSSEGIVEEYEYDGKKYVRVTATFFQKSKTILSNGCEYDYGSKVWVRVEPIKLIVTKDNFSSLTEKILFAGVPYDKTITQDAITCARSGVFIHFLLNNNGDDFFFTAESSIYDRIVSGTDWMKLYLYTKSKYAEFNIPFEETELEASERYKQELQKVKEYCKKYRLDMQYNDFNKDVTKGTIEYSYRRPSVEFLNSIDNPITATLAALGPREIWNKQFYKEYLKKYGLYAIVIIKEENINQISNKLYDDILDKSYRYYLGLENTGKTLTLNNDKKIK